LAQTKPAQKKSAPEQKPKAEGRPVSTAAGNEEQVREMVVFLEYLLNTVGGVGTPARDKEVVITESYSRIFRDSQVQVEDDLDEGRSVSTNKDVTAYLKDVHFFFKDVKFEFIIDYIREQGTADGQVVYLVGLTRNLKGITADGKTINNTLPRFIEVNYNPATQDLKIVSVYTHPIDEKAALISWWNDLSFEWQKILTRELPEGERMDSLPFQQMKAITACQSLDLSYNPYVQDFSPLARLTQLKKLNLEGTHISDLTSIRNLTELTDLNLAGTNVNSIEALRYANKLQRLDVSRTPIQDIWVVQKFPDLRSLNISRTRVVDITPLKDTGELSQLNLSSSQVSNFAPLSGVTSLAELDLSNTTIQSLSDLGGLKQLTVLRFDSTQIRDITPLGRLEKLRELSMNHTVVENLDPLKKLPQLEKIYCDQSSITRTQAESFMAGKPGVLVIVDSKDWSLWWDALPEEWQSVLRQLVALTSKPGKEDFAKISLIDSIHIGGNSSIRDLTPLQMLLKLRVLLAGKSAISDLSPLSNHRDLELLDISDTQVRDISVLKSFSKLKTLVADNSMIQYMDVLTGLPSLVKVYADNTPIHEFLVQEFLEKNPKCLVIYKSSFLERWWLGLSESWKDAFQRLVPLRPHRRREDLHFLVEMESVEFKNENISDLTPLKAFVRLKSLSISNTTVTDLSPLMAIPSITTLHVANNPIRTIEPVKLMPNLTALDISNTAIRDLRPVASLVHLRRFNCSGTPVSRIHAIERLKYLEYVDLSNTNVSRLDALKGLPLKMLICYNTGLSKRKIEAFKQSNPECRVVYYR
jgi:Leucine-rich repeat (LRR) protein